MVLFHKNIFKFFSLLLLVLISFSCSKEDTQKNEKEEDKIPQTPSYSIYTNESSLKSMQVIKIYSDGFDFSPEQNNFYINGDISFNMKMLNDSTVHGFIPSIDSGVHTISYIQNNEELKFDLQIVNKSIDNIDSQIESEVIAPLNDLRVYLEQNQSDNQPELAKYSTIIQEYIKELENSDEANKTKAFRFFNSNPEVLELLNIFKVQETNTLSKLSDDDLEVNLINEAKQYSIFMTAAVVSITVVALGIDLKVKEAVVVGVVGLAITINRMLKSQNTILNSAFTPIQAELDELTIDKRSNYYFSKNTNEIVFLNKKESVLKVNVIEETFSTKFKDYNNSTLDELFENHIELSEEYREFAETFNSAINWMNSVIEDYSDFQFYTIDAEWEAIPDYPLSTRENNLQNGVVKFINLPKGTESNYNPDNGTIKFLFDAENPNILPENYDVSLEITEQIIDIKEDYVFSLKNSAQLEVISGNGQTGKYGEYLSDNITLLVKDFQNNNYPNIDVYYKITGGGSINSTNNYLTSNSNGEISVKWKLGNNEDQSINFYIKDSNNEIISNTTVTSQKDTYSISIVSNQGIQLNNDSKVEVKITSNSDNSIVPLVSVFSEIIEGQFEVNGMAITDSEEGIAPFTVNTSNIDQEVFKLRFYILNSDNAVMDEKTVTLTPILDPLAGVWIYTIGHSDTISEKHRIHFEGQHIQNTSSQYYSFYQNKWQNSTRTWFIKDHSYSKIISLKTLIPPYIDTLLVNFPYDNILDRSFIVNEAYGNFKKLERE